MNKNEKIVRDACHVIWTEGDTNRTSEFYAKDYKADYPFGDGWGVGVDGVKAFADSIRTGFPDYAEEIVDILVDGDTVAVKLRVTGTHTGPINGIPPTNRKVDFRDMTILKIKDGKITEQSGLTDNLTLFAQIGVLELPAIMAQHVKIESALGQPVEELAPPFALYNGSDQSKNFCQMATLFPNTTMKPSPVITTFPDGEPLVMPMEYTWNGQIKSTLAFAQETDTNALLVLHKGKVRHESYFMSGGKNIPWISWSVAKSFISALIGIAIDEKKIGSVDDKMSDYVTSFRGSAYENVRIEDVLQMSSGAKWNEDYSDPNSDVNRLGAVMAGMMSLEEFVASIQAAVEPGTVCQYNSADTQALGILLKYATGQSVTEYMQEKLISPLGMECESHWLIDKVGMELVLGGLNMTARDFAKFGELYRNNGRVGDKQIVPEDWVKRSVTSSASHLQPEKVLVGGHPFPFGYGYQWWIPAGDRGEFSAIGVYNQFIFIDPSREVTIVKLSSNRQYGTANDEAVNREAETMAVLRTIAATMEN